MGKHLDRALGLNKTVTETAKYELEKDETGNLVLPSNAVGTYSDDTTEVTYYYVEKENKITELEAKLAELEKPVDQPLDMKAQPQPFTVKSSGALKYFE